MNNQQALAVKFEAKHRQNALFVMPCAWDPMSALLFEQAGFACIGTTSGGVNWIQARKDYVYSTPAQEMIDAYGKIAQATTLPVSGDLENGYGENPATVADTIKQAIAAGMVGGSIEDQETVPSDDAGTNGSLFDVDTAVQRIEAARTAADESGISFTLTARCEVFYTQVGNPFQVAIERLNAYREAGADCLFVPGLNDIEQLTQLVKEVDGPISFGMGATPKPLSLTMLEDIGIRRVSTGGGITRAIIALTQSIAQELSHDGDFSYLQNTVSESDINLLLDTAVR